MSHKFCCSLRILFCASFSHYYVKLNVTLTPWIRWPLLRWSGNSTLFTKSEGLLMFVSRRQNSGQIKLQKNRIWKIWILRIGVHLFFHTLRLSVTVLTI
jgi:hypothetical protein